MSSFIRRFISTLLGSLTSAVLYAIWCGLFYYLHIYLLSPKNAGEWEKTGLIFFVVLGFIAGTIIGCIAGLLRISRVTTALLACCLTSAFVLLLISDDLAHMDVPSFRTLAFASVLFHLIIGAFIGLACHDIREYVTPQKTKRKRVSTEIINLNPASAVPYRMPNLPRKINFSKAFEHTEIAKPPVIPSVAPFMTSLVLEVPSAPVNEISQAEKALKISYCLIESFPNPLHLRDLHVGLLPATTCDSKVAAKVAELPSIPMPHNIRGLATA